MKGKTEILGLKLKNITLHESLQNKYAHAKPDDVTIKEIKKEIINFLHHLINVAQVVTYKEDYDWINDTFFSWNLILKDEFLEYKDFEIPIRNNLVRVDKTETKKGIEQILEGNSQAFKGLIYYLESELGYSIKANPQISYLFKEKFEKDSPVKIANIQSRHREQPYEKIDPLKGMELHVPNYENLTEN